MRLGRTDPRRQLPRTNADQKSNARGPLRLVPIAFACLLLLAGCNTGNIQESRGAMNRDAERPSLMPLQQATRIAERYFPPTVAASPPPPPAPVAGDIAVTTASNPDGSPRGSFASFPVDSGQIFAIAELHFATDGQKITSIMTDSWGNTASEASVDLTGNADPRWVSLPMAISSDLVPGSYAIWLYSGNRRVASVAFALTDRGTAPQMYPEEPANPQAPAPTVQATVQPGGVTQTQTPQGQGDQQNQGQPAQGQWDPQGQPIAPAGNGAPAP